MYIHVGRAASSFTVSKAMSLTGLGFTRLMKWSSKEQALPAATAQCMAFKGVREDTYNYTDAF